jgi:UDP-glucuronate 4-epimerase
MKILVTGAAGFIGSHVASRMASEGHQVLCVDNFSPYYDPMLKKLRVSELISNLEISNLDISEPEQIRNLIREFNPESVIHLAAQAGVRMPKTQFYNYVRDNLLGFSNVALAAAESGVTSFLYASSSSVYGDETAIPYVESERSLKPKSFYGATKLSNEVLAQTISVQFGMRMRGLRFFTVYGPWGRPDMAYFRLIGNAAVNSPFKLFGDGSIRRDFTFIEDTVDSTLDLHRNLLEKSSGFCDVVNVGGGSPRSMNDLIGVISKISNREIKLENHLPDSADVAITSANSKYLESLIGSKRFLSLEEGIERTWSWSTRDDITKYLKPWITSAP